MRVAVVYANAYEVAMASLGFQRLRRLAVDSGHAHVERAFAMPSPGRALESEIQLGDFDLLLFSIAFEMDFPSVPAILDAAGIAPLARRRIESDPLVVAGGPALLVNRMPLYPFVDAFALGDAECLVEPILRAPARAASRGDIAQAWAALPGVEVTTGFAMASGATLDGAEAVERRIVEDLEASMAENRTPAGIAPSPPAPAETDDPAALRAAADIVTDRAQLGRRVLIEIARGCPHRCPFCWMGCRSRPAVVQPADALLALAAEACERTGCADLGLIASAVGAHPEIDRLCEGLLARGHGLSFSSLRAEELRPSLIDALVRSGQRGLTLAPETGSEALRRRIGKNLSDAALIEAVEAAQQAGLDDLKLYFMLGLPGEEDDDARAIADLADRTRQVMLRHGRARGKLGTLSVNLGIYVPKPGTPLARRPRPDVESLRRRLGETTRLLRALPNTRVAATGMEEAAAQDALANGGLEAADLVYGMWRTGKRWRSAAKRYARRRGAAR